MTEYNSEINSRDTRETLNTLKSPPYCKLYLEIDDYILPIFRNIPTVLARTFTIQPNVVKYKLLSTSLNISDW